MRRRMYLHSAPEDWGRHHGGFGPFGHGHLPFPPPGPPFPPGAWGFGGRGRGPGGVDENGVWRVPLAWREELDRGVSS